LLFAQASFFGPYEVLWWGASAEGAMSRVETLALCAIANRLENGESEPFRISFSLPVNA